ncbi:MAG: DUF1501 domain-containing protein [Planctomycetaceae bacterium]
MLNLIAQNGRRDCDGWRRRECLRVGVLGLGGLTLPGLLAAKAATGESAKETSVVLLFLTGGPSQIESFDPKMTAPAEVRSATGETATSLPGVTFGGTFPKLARLAKQMAVVRSFTHGNSNHTGGVEDVIQGRNRTGAGMGSIAARLRGATHPATGLPTHVYLDYAEKDPQYNKERLRLLKAASAASLGAPYSPFQPAGGGQVNRNLTLNISASRLHDRRALRRSLDRLHRRVDLLDELAAVDTFEQQAFDLILGKAKAAFDLANEDPRLVRKYDTSRFNTALRIKNRPSSLGHQLLLARRLCEAGCGFITIHNPGWDMHGGKTQFNVPAGMETLGRPVDRAVSAFLQDVAERGLSGRILLIVTGEFGRTPKVKSNGGRDHWPRLSTLAFAGGGLRMGQIVGRSNSRAEAPQSGVVTPENLLATVLHVLFDVASLRVRRGIPRELTAILERGEPIRSLI